MTRSDKANQDMSALLRARNPLIWIVTREERRVERAIIDSSQAHRYPPAAWDCCSGLQRVRDAENDPPGDIWAELDTAIQDPMAILDKIRTDPTRRLYILRDFHRHLEQDPFTVRALRNLCLSLPRAPLNEARAIVILTPEGSPPPQIAAHAIVLDYPLPERQEIGAILDSAAAPYPEVMATLQNGLRERAIDAAIGLTSQEAESTYARSIVTTSPRRIDPEAVSADKKRVIARERVTTWIDPDPRGLDAVGGLDLYKAWLMQRSLALTAAARTYGLPSPKGVLTVGVPGCGKSLMAKAIATAWKLPLLRLDFGALKSKYVGDSESQIRKALATAEAIAPCVLWIDEIEKGLAGASGGNDGGVSADQLGAFLSWMQDRTAPVFVVATANDVSALPPELLRKGRFDDLFFVDLPNRSERVAVLSATLQAHGRSPGLAACERVAMATDGFSGAELAALVPDAMFAAFADGAREITAEDLLSAAAAVTPLSKTASEKIQGLRNWAKGRARPASIQDSGSIGHTAGRQLDVDE